MAAAVAPARSRSMSRQPTAAPTSAKTSAMARPIPSAAPVTMAVFPASDGAIKWASWVSSTRFFYPPPCGEGRRASSRGGVGVVQWGTEVPHRTTPTPIPPRKGEGSYCCTAVHNSQRDARLRAAAEIGLAHALVGAQRVARAAQDDRAGLQHVAAARALERITGVLLDQQHAGTGHIDRPDGA